MIGKSFEKNNTTIVLNILNIKEKEKKNFQLLFQNITQSVKNK